MDAYNLSVVLCPNLVKSSNLARDIMMCAVPGGPSIFESNVPTAPNGASQAEERTTLGMVIFLCIRRYYEVFDETWDRSEALPQSRSFQDDAAVSSGRSSASASPPPQDPSHDDDDIDDAVLVMPIGPSQSNGSSKLDRPPSAWGSPSNGGLTYKPRHRTNASGGPSGVRSVYTAFGDNANGSVSGAGYAYLSMSKSKSMISIEKGAGTVGGRKGSIAVGRGTTRKSSGAGVEAISITAEGFFCAPSTAPPVPPPRRVDGSRLNGDDTS